MRWIFFALVFVNLLLLAVFWQQRALQQAPLVERFEVPNSNKRILLISELEQPLIAVAKHHGSVVESDPVCYVAGPYVDSIDARHLLVRAESLGFAGVIKTVSLATEEPSEYWVHVPPQTTRDEALRILKVLQKRKIDSYIITQGDLAEGVSLGLFRNKSSATRLREKVTEFGMPVEIRVINESRQEYWVEIAQVAQLNAEMRQRILGNDSNVDWQQAVCSDSSDVQLSRVSR